MKNFQKIIQRPFGKSSQNILQYWDINKKSLDSVRFIKIIELMKIFITVILGH